MADPLTIVHLLPSLGVGGAESLVVSLATTQQAQGHEVHIVCVSEAGPLSERLPASLRARVRVAGKRRRFDVTVLRRLRRIFLELRPDVVHTHIFTGLAWGSVAARLAGVPVVVHTQHACHDDEYRYLPFVRRRLAWLVDRIVACSAEVEADIHRRRYAPPRKVSTIENGIPLAGRPVATLEGDPPRLVSVGRLVEVKGHVHLIRAVRMLQERGVRVDLVLVGDGPERTALEAEAADLGERVRFVGRSDTVDTWLSEADLFVMPSLSEGLPMALLEACAAGLPVLLTSGGGMKVVVERGAGGWVVPPADPDALADRIAAFAALSHPERLSLGARSLALVQAHYGIEACARRYEALYRAAADG